MNAPREPRVIANLENVLVRAWTPDLGAEGARFTALTVRRAPVMQNIRHGSFRFEKTIDGIVIAAAGATQAKLDQGGFEAVDVIIRGIVDSIKLTISATDEFVWVPTEAHRDEVDYWHISAIPMTEWLRTRIGDDPEGPEPGRIL